MPYINPGQNAEWLEAGNTLPEAALAQIPVSLQGAIAQGNRGFFADLEKDFPKTFAALVDAAPVQLLHLTVERFSLMGNGGEDHLFYWVVQMEDKALEIQVPNREPDSETRRKYHLKFLDALPPALHCFYLRTDGMGVTPDYGQPGGDFPMRFSDWVSIMDFARDRGLDSLAVQDAAEALGLVDGHVCSVLQGGAVLAVDMAGKPGRLAFLDPAEPTRSAAIDNVAAALDGYLSRVLQLPWGQVDWRGD